MEKVIVFWFRNGQENGYEVVRYDGILYKCRREDLEFIGQDYCRIAKNKLLPYK